MPPNARVLPIKLHRLSGKRENSLPRSALFPYPLTLPLSLPLSFTIRSFSLHPTPLLPSSSRSLSLSHVPISLSSHVHRICPSVCSLAQNEDPSYVASEAIAIEITIDDHRVLLANNRPKFHLAKSDSRNEAQLG